MACCLAHFVLDKGLLNFSEKALSCTEDSQDCDIIKVGEKYQFIKYMQYKILSIWCSSGGRETVS